MTGAPAAAAAPSGTGRTPPTSPPLSPAAVGGAPMAADGGWAGGDAGGAGAAAAAGRWDYMVRLVGALYSQGLLHTPALVGWLLSKAPTLSPAAHLQLLSLLSLTLGVSGVGVAQECGASAWAVLAHQGLCPRRTAGRYLPGKGRMAKGEGTGPRKVGSHLTSPSARRARRRRLRNRRPCCVRSWLPASSRLPRCHRRHGPRASLPPAAQPRAPSRQDRRRQQLRMASSSSRSSSSLSCCGGMLVQLLPCWPSPPWHLCLWTRPPWPPWQPCCSRRRAGGRRAALPRSRRRPQGLPWPHQPWGYCVRWRPCSSGWPAR